MVKDTSFLKGSFVALATPFRHGKVDEPRLKALVDYHIQNRTDGLVPCGSTGESATLSHREHQRVVDLVVKAARGRIPVLAGTGSNSTEETLDLTRHAYQSGVDGVLLVAPYYNKPMPQGLYEHFKTVARATPLPIVLYNIPGRCGINIPVETVVRLAQDCPTVVGIKEASGSMDYTSQLLHDIGDSHRFVVFSGDDSLTVSLMAIGARGVISVLGNIMPSPMANLCHAALRGDFVLAQDIHNQLFPVMRALFMETNPIPLKTAMAHLGLCREELRLPLTPLNPEHKKKLIRALAECSLLRTRSRS